LKKFNYQTNIVNIRFPGVKKDRPFTNFENRSGRGIWKELKNFAEKLDLAVLPTPIQPAGRLSALLGSERVLLKRDDLTGMALSGNKIRKLEYCAAAALARGADVLITCGGPQSNHARATAAVAAKLGLECHLVLNGDPQGVPEGNLFLDLLFGAETTFVSVPDLRDQDECMEEIAQTYRSRGRRPYIIPLGASDALGSLGYIDAMGEAAEQTAAMGIALDRVVFSCGSGGTLAGIVAGCLVHGLDCKVTAVSVAFPASWVIEKVEEVFTDLRDEYITDLPDPHGKYEVVDGYIGEGYGKASPDLIGFIKRAASLEAILVDPTYSGKALFGLAGEIGKGAIGKEERVLFIHTGGVFGLFPYRDRFLPDIREKGAAAPDGRGG
jgi:D-cysteine desulfhydrase